ncbi:MAG TPA: GNAT family N-acetyltransferase [Anaerolineales bacterium]|nr:GNAT family N-acetyltransferase [Anaerolineales bacterium]
MSDPAPFPYSLRGYTPGDEEALVQLFNRAYGKSVSQAYWRWKIKGYPSEVENVWLAFDGPRAIFQYAGLPLRYHLGGQVRTGMVGADAMTDPDYRRNGLLTRGSQHAFEIWRHAGVAFNIGLPNERWGSRQEALGWKPLFILQWMFYPLWPEAMLARKLKWPFLRKSRFFAKRWIARRVATNPNLQLEAVTQADVTFDQLWTKIRDGFHFSVIRDRQWIQWRYLDSPIFPYRVLTARAGNDLLGYAVYRVDEKTSLCFIAEIITARQDKATWQALLRSVLGKMEMAGVETVLTQIPRPGWQYRQYQQNGFFPGRHGFQVRMVQLDPTLSFPALCDAEQWLMCGGDFDAI